MTLALAAALKPLMTRIGDRAAMSGASPGCRSTPPIGQASRLATTARLAPIPPAIQKTVDCSSTVASCRRASAVLRPPSASTLQNSTNGTARETRP